MSITIDARDKPCPIPILMTKRGLEGAKLGDTLTIMVNDHIAKDNVLKYCWNHGQKIVKSFESDSDFTIVIEKSPEKLSDKPFPVVGPCGNKWS